MTRPAIDIARAFDDRNLLGAALEDPTTWATWRVILKAAHGLPLDDHEAATFSNLAGGRTAPTQRVSELWCVAGRRSGKSRMAACVAAYVAAFSQHKLAPGEVGHVLVLAPSRAQAAETHGYVAGFLSSSPILHKQVESIGAEEIRLRGRISIGTHAASFRTVRGRTLLACVLDESAFWRDETSANPDVEVYRAILPALATTSGLLVGISSPYRRAGLLHQKHCDHFGKDSDVLVVRAATPTLNPTIDQAAIDRAMAEDPEGARSEWFAEFRSDLLGLLADDVVDSAIDFDRPLELPPRPELQYTAFVDASAGRSDSFTLCIGHRDGEEFIADVIRGARPPFDPVSVAAEYAALARQYNCIKVVGDNYAGEWVASAFQTANVAYERSPRSKSAIYLEALPHFNRGLVNIPDIPALTRELRLLQRSTHRSGKDSVDHPRGDTDDLANALCGALVTAVSGPVYGMLSDAVLDRVPGQELGYLKRYQMQTGYGLGLNWHERHRFLRGY